MLTKQAAEKLAQEYYTVGQQLALQNAGLEKQANALSKLPKKALKEYLALLGGAGGMLTGMSMLERLGMGGNSLTDLLIAAPTLAGATSGAHQLSRKGLNKLIN
jgi:hypothetical protein